MHRLFVAIDLPEEVKQGVADLGGSLPGGRWVPREQLHLTLRFIGEVDDESFSAIRGALAEVRGAPFSMALRGIGHFPPGRHPRVLWVGLEGYEPLIELQQRVESALVTAGIVPEERRFSPHITIARLKETPAAAVEAYEERHAAFRAGPVPVGEFHLYSSALSRAGAIHTREASYPLAEGR
jgi:2'-5' RNA ligase